MFVIVVVVIVVCVVLAAAAVDFVMSIILTYYFPVEHDWNRSMHSNNVPYML